ncbi:hypothetical protein P9112_012192 [Eukaryota sp. TZLM1-RC]
MNELLPLSPFYICKTSDGTIFYAKSFANSSFISLLVTDMIHCWYGSQDEDVIQALRERSQMSFIVEENATFLPMIIQWFSKSEAGISSDIKLITPTQLKYTLSVSKDPLVFDWPISCSLVKDSAVVLKDYFTLPMFKCLCALNSSISNKLVRRAKHVNEGDLSLSQPLQSLWRKVVLNEGDEVESPSSTNSSTLTETLSSQSLSQSSQLSLDYQDHVSFVHRKRRAK